MLLPAPLNPALGARRPGAGRMDEDEQNVLMDRLAAALLGDDRYWQRRANIAAMVRRTALLA